MQTEQTIVAAYLNHIDTKAFPCVAAKAAFAKDQIHCLVVEHMACPADDQRILNFIYDFVDVYRNLNRSYHSAAVIFREPLVLDEVSFDRFLWQRLNALNSLDKKKYLHDPRVDSNPDSAHFSFSLKGEAFFVIGLHSASSRKSRQFEYPTLAFNPHAEFEKLRKAGRYERMKKTVRQRDIAFSGSVNPTLKDFGEASEVYQYSGMVYDQTWKCPLENNHGENKHNSAP
jgi:FPC/CPF motif-containing protein YcgG